MKATDLKYARLILRELALALEVAAGLSAQPTSERELVALLQMGIDRVTLLRAVEVLEREEALTAKDEPATEVVQ